MIKITQIPSILVGLRFSIAPLLLLDALDKNITVWFTIGYVIAVISDIFDGIIARRLNVSTTKLRQADSCADICLYLCVAISVCLVYPEVISSFQIPLLTAISAQLILFAISLTKFRAFPSFHTYTAKIWGLTLLVATVALFSFDYEKTIWLPILLCVINSIEEIIMTLLSSEWRCDVLSIFHLIELQKNEIAKTKQT